MNHIWNVRIVIQKELLLKFVKKYVKRNQHMYIYNVCNNIIHTICVCCLYY